MILPLSRGIVYVNNKVETIVRFKLTPFNLKLDYYVNNSVTFLSVGRIEEATVYLSSSQDAT